MLTLRHRRSTDPRGWSQAPRPTVGRRGLLLLLAVTLAGGMFVGVPARNVQADALSDAIAKQKALQAQIDASKAQIAALTSSQAALSGQLSTTKTTLTSVNVDLNAVKSQIVTMTVTVAQAQAGVDELDATVASLDGQIADLESQALIKQTQLDARIATLSERIRLAYDTDRTSLLEALLSGRDFTDVITEVGYHLDVAQQDKALAEQIVADQRVLGVLHDTVLSARGQAEQMRIYAAQQKAALDVQLAQLADAREQLAQLEAQTRDLLALQEAQYSQLASDKAALQAALAADLKAEQDLEKLIEKLVAEALAKGGIPKEYQGKFIWPLVGIVTQEFGCTGFYLEPPLGSCAHFHTGIDIAAPLYSAIRAAGAGKVIFAGKSPYSTAWVVVIAHAANLVSWYVHIDNSSHPPAVTVGQFVAQGQVIAYVGLTGNTTGPHLHWAVQLNNTWVNPRLFL